MVHLNNIWYLIVAVFWVGFFVLEGFDFGVGMLHSFVGHDDVERRIAVNSIGPIWDGNEVWLIVGVPPSSPPSPPGMPPCSPPSTGPGGGARGSDRAGASFEFHRKVDDPRGGRPGGGPSRSEPAHPLLLGTASATSSTGCPSTRPQLHGIVLGAPPALRLYTGSPHRPLPVPRAAYLTLKTDGELHDRVSRLSGGSAGWPP